VIVEDDGTKSPARSSVPGFFLWSIPPRRSAIGLGRGQFSGTQIQAVSGP